MGTTSLLESSRKFHTHTHLIKNRAIIYNLIKLHILFGAKCVRSGRNENFLILIVRIEIKKDGQDFKDLFKNYPFFKNMPSLK